MKEPKIIFEDEDVLVLDKPAGMVVNRSDTTKRERTLQDWLEDKFSIFNFQFSNKSQIQNSNDQNDTRSTDFYNRSGIVHRLDKETSGILIVAKNPQSFENLQKQFKERVVKKTYVALVHGEVKPKEGEIKAAVGRLPWNRMRFGVLSGGREAVTRYKVLSVFSCRLSESSLSGDQFISHQNRITEKPMNQNPKTENRKQITETCSLLELYPETGRTHQIRVHLKYINHPIFSDFLYAGRKTARNYRKFLSRVFLHAAKISFVHPISSNQITLESPLPQELQRFLDSYCVERKF